MWYAATKSAPKGGRRLKTTPAVRPKRQDVLRAMKLANDYFTARWPNPGTNDGLPGKRPSVIRTRAGYFEGALAAPPALTNSTTKIRVASGGMTAPAPRVP